MIPKKSLQFQMAVEGEEFDGSIEPPPDNLLDAAMYEAEFYERVQAFGGWIYRIDESIVEQYRNHQTVFLTNE